MKIVAVIPCHNEAANITNVVKGLKAFSDVLPLVVDNNSWDGTAARAKAAGASVLQHKIPGYGSTLIAGFKEAVGKYQADIVVTLDGDGQHNPHEIQKLIAPVLIGSADLVIGSRFLGKIGTPFYRHLGISVINRLFNTGHKIQVTDSQSGYRVYSRRLIDSLELTEPGMAFSIESLVKSRAEEARIHEIPIQVYYHEDWHLNSSIHPFKHGMQVAWSVMKWRLREEFHIRKRPTLQPALPGGNSLIKVQGRSD